MYIGFTGTRSGMSEQQLYNIYHYLMHISVFYKKIEVGHGACVGADEQFHVLARCFTDIIHIYPGYSVNDPDDLSLRVSFDEGITYPPLSHFKRNRIIVQNCDILLACPYNDIQKGGTWYTINYAKKINKECIIFSR